MWDGVRVASGETGVIPSIYVWESNNCTILNTFKGILKRGVDLLSFNPDGSKLAASGRDDNHTIVIYDLTSKISVGGYKILE